MKHLFVFLVILVAIQCSSVEEPSLRVRSGGFSHTAPVKPPVNYLSGLPVACLACDRYANNYADSLKGPENVKAIQDYLRPTCDKLGFLAQGCKDLLESHVLYIIQILLRSVNPYKSCVELGFCPEQIPLPTKFGYDGPMDSVTCTESINRFGLNLIQIMDSDIQVIVDEFCPPIGHSECASILSQILMNMADFVQRNARNVQEQICNV